MGNDQRKSEAADAALKDYRAGVESLRGVAAGLGVAVLKLRRIEEASEVLRGTDAENAPAEAREQFFACVWTLVSFLVASRWDRELADRALDDFISRCDLALRVLDKVEAGEIQQAPLGVQ